VFPETVFNAPASHLAALLGTNAVSYTLVGDPGTFLQGLALGASWLCENEVDACLVVGAEEVDWLTADAYRLFNRSVILAEGAGALCLRRAGEDASGVILEAVTNSHNYSRGTTRNEACTRMRNELLATGQADLLCDGTAGEERQDRSEVRAWKGWRASRLSPKRNVGEGLAAASAWQCALAVDWLLERGEGSACVSVAGCNEQAIGARFGWKGSP
jgi:3-oxoacyl-(acyl-carrier-protein) synthase